MNESLAFAGREALVAQLTPMTLPSAVIWSNSGAVCVSRSSHDNGVRKRSDSAGGEPHDILSPGSADGPRTGEPDAPACCRDLHLDQIVEAITSSRREHPFFLAILIPTGFFFP